MKISNIGLAAWEVSADASESLCIMGLGSCLAIGVYDPVAKVAGLLHAMLPNNTRKDDSKTKYVDSGLEFLLEQAVEAGAARERLRVAVYGGSTMLSQGGSSLLEIGPKNIATAEKMLASLGLTPAVWDVGGSKGRTVAFAVGTGEISVTVLGQPVQVFRELSESPEVKP